MCSRYYIDEATVRAISRFPGGPFVRDKERTGDIRPGELAWVLCLEDNQICARQMKWGFPWTSGRGLLLNARAESAMEKPAFRDSMRRRRCLIPARGFYEWNRSKEKYSFERPDDRELYMAGCYQWHEDQAHFVILTEPADDSVSPVHHRMPLLAERQEIESWLLDAGMLDVLLHRSGVHLDCHTEYQQLSLF